MTRYCCLPLLDHLQFSRIAPGAPFVVGHSRSSTEAQECVIAWFRMMLLRGRCWRGLTLATVEHGIIALVAFLKAHVRSEHVRAALRLLEFIHPPIRHLAGLVGILSAGAVRSVDDRNALHLVAIVLRIGPGDTNSDFRLPVIQGKRLR